MAAWSSSLFVFSKIVIHTACANIIFPTVVFSDLPVQMLPRKAEAVEFRFFSPIGASPSINSQKFCSRKAHDDDKRNNIIHFLEKATSIADRSIHLKTNQSEIHSNQLAEQKFSNHGINQCASSILDQIAGGARTSSMLYQRRCWWPTSSSTRQDFPNPRRRKSQPCPCSETETAASSYA